MNTTTSTLPPGSRPQLGASPTAPVSVPGRLRRRRVMVGLSAALVSLGGVIGFLVWSMSTSSAEVVAVRTAVERGQVITAADLMVLRVSVDPAVAVVPEAEFEQVVGRRAAVDLVPGSLLSPAAVTDAVVPATGESMVGIALGTGQLPAEPLLPGDRVRLVQTPADQAEVPATQVTIDAVVQQLTAAPDGRTVVLDVIVPSSRAAEVAARAATGRVAVVLDSRER